MYFEMMLERLEDVSRCLPTFCRQGGLYLQILFILILWKIN